MTERFPPEHRFAPKAQVYRRLLSAALWGLLIGYFVLLTKASGTIWPLLALELYALVLLMICASALASARTRSILLPEADTWVRYRPYFLVVGGLSTLLLVATTIQIISQRP